MKRQTTVWQLVTRWMIFVGAVGIIASFALAAITESWAATAVWVTLTVGAVLCVGSALLNYKWLGRGLAPRKALVALNVLVMVILAGAILAGANYLAERRLPISWRRIDITSRGLYKLGSQTRNLLEGLDKEVRVCALLSNPKIAEKLQDFPFAQEARDLLEEYDAASPKLNVSFVDMMRDPASAWEFVIWVKLPKTLDEYKIPKGKFRRAFQKSKVDTITGFNLLRIINDWEGPPSKIRSVAEQKAEQSVELPQFGEEMSKEDLQDLKEDIKSKTDKVAAKLTGFLRRIKELMADAKLDGDKQKEFLKAIKDLDIPEPESNSVIFVCGDRSKHIKQYDMTHTDYGRTPRPDQESKKQFKGEDAFTSAIKEIIEEEQMNVYFITGHGERRTGEYGQSGYSDIKSALEKANYKVETLDMMREGKIPSACDVLVAAAPVIPYNEGELTLIRKYVESGGALLALLEPLFPSSRRMERRPSGLAGLLKEYNINAREDVSVLDVAHVLALTRKGLERVPQLQGSVQVIKYPDHRIVRDMQGTPSTFHWACFVDAAEQPGRQEFAATRLLQGSKDGWGETNLEMLKVQRAEKKKSEDVMPPVPIGAASESKKKFEREVVADEQGEPKKRKPKPIRIVAIGDSDFAANSSADIHGNTDLFLNTVSWLAGKESQIGVGPSTGKIAPLALSSKEKQGIFYGTVVALPTAWVVFALLIIPMRSLRSTGLTLETVAKLGAFVGILLIVISVIVSAVWVGMGVISTIALAAGIVLLAASLWLSRGFIRDMLRGRKTLVGANVGVMVVLALVVLGLVCFTSTREYLRSDLTKDKKHALDAAALDVVRSVAKWVDIHAMYLAAGAAYHPVLSKVEDALQEFDYNSDYIEINHVPYDKEKREAFFNALKLEPDERTVVVFQRGDKVRHVSYDDLLVQDMPPQMMQQYRMQGMPPPPPKFRGQEALANALAGIVKDEEMVIYFATGHKERDIENYKAGGFGELHNVLRRKGYEVRKVNLKEAGEAPKDCGLLVIAAPETAYDQAEIDILRRYCGRNGRLLVMLEPTLGQREPSGLGALLSEYKIKVNESVLIVDSGKSVRLTRQGLVTVARPRVQVQVTDSGYCYHDITDKMRGVGTVFDIACEVDAEEGPPQQPQYPGAPPPRDDSPYKATKLLKASDKGWGETNVADGRAEYSDREDKKGPVPFAACVAPKEKQRMPWSPPDESGGPTGPRIVCIGDADFASTRLIKEGGNEAFLMRCIHWLAKDEGQIKIPPVTLESKQMAELKSKQKKWTFAICLGGLPMAWITLGLLVWGIRRRQP